MEQLQNASNSANFVFGFYIFLIVITVDQKPRSVISSPRVVPRSAGIVARVTGNDVLNHEHTYARADHHGRYAHLGRHLTPVERPRNLERQVTLRHEALDRRSLARVERPVAERERLYDRRDWTPRDIIEKPRFSDGGRIFAT